MTRTKAIKKAQEKYHAKLERMVVRMSAAEKKAVKDFQQKTGLSIRELLLKAIKSK